jgi:predicted porin
MKKSLFALAAVTAFAGAAQAQSSVTVYGILDVGFVGANERDSISGATTKQQVSGFGAGAQQTNRLGFRGTEDLGGGTAAFFTIETELTPQGTSYSSSANRQTFVGLSQKGIGQFSIGTQYTTIHNAIAKTDPGSLNNIAGNVINPQASGVSAGVGSSGSDGNNLSYTVRASNMLALQSANFAGIVGNAFYVQNNANSTQAGVGTTSAGGNVNNTGWGLGADYTWKQLLVTANYQSFKGENNTTTSAATVTTTGALTATNATDNQMYLGATYNFGILKAYANYIDRKVTATANSNLYVKRTAQQLGVRGNWTPKIESWASMGTGRFNSSGSTSPTVNFNGWQVGSNYFLSKRTNLYAIYGQEQTSSVSGSNNSYALSNYGVGVRHTF